MAGYVYVKYVCMYRSRPEPPEQLACPLEQQLNTQQWRAHPETAAVQNRRFSPFSYVLHSLASAVSSRLKEHGRAENHLLPRSLTWGLQHWEWESHKERMEMAGLLDEVAVLATSDIHSDTRDAQNSRHRQSNAQASIGGD